MSVLTAFEAFRFTFKGACRKVFFCFNLESSNMRIVPYPTITFNTLFRFCCIVDVSGEKSIIIVSSTYANEILDTHFVGNADSEGRFPCACLFEGVFKKRAPNNYNFRLIYGEISKVSAHFHHTIQIHFRILHIRLFDVFL